MSAQGKYVLAAAGAAVSMATIGVFSRYSEMPADLITFFRLSLGAACLLLLVVYQKETLKLTLSIWMSCALSGFYLAGFILFYILAMNYTLMANAIFTVYLGPLLATLLAFFIRRQHLTKVQWWLIGIAFLGFLLMQNGLSVNELNVGLMFAVVAMAFYAGFIYVNGGIPKQINPAVSAFWQLLSGALLVLPIVLINQHSWQLTSAQWTLMVVVGLWPGFIALYLAIVALKHLPTGIYGTLTYLEPVAVSVFGWVLFGESLTWVQLSGGILIITAGTMQALSHSRKQV